LFRRSDDGLFLLCIDDSVAQKLVNDIPRSTICILHIGGHFVAKSSAFKILSYYWPSTFRDSYEFTRACDKYQKFTGIEHFSTIPL